MAFINSYYIRKDFFGYLQKKSYICKKIWIMFEKLKHIKRQFLIKYRFHDMTQRTHYHSQPALKELGCRGLPVFAPYVKKDDMFYIVDKFEIIPIKFSWISIKLREGNAIISAVTTTEAEEFNSREVLIRIVSGREGYGIIVTFLRFSNHKYTYVEEMDMPLYRTDKDALDHKIYKGVVNILSIPFYPAVSFARMKEDVLCLYYWIVGCDKILGTVPEQKRYETSTLFFKENRITVDGGSLGTIPGDTIYKTKEEAEKVIYESLLHSYYINNTPKDDTETICH